MDRQQAIQRLLDHYQHPRYRAVLPNADVVQPGGAPDCGDTITIYLKLAPSGEQIAQLSFEGQGCTISQAAASLLAERLQGAAFEVVETLEGEQLIEELGRDVVGSRPRCATLALNTLKAAVITARRRVLQAQA